MSNLEELILSGRIVDLMLVVISVEVIAVLLYRRLRGGGIAALPLLMNVGAGGSLMVALKFALSGAPWTWLAGSLIASLVFHVTDQALRWQRATRQA